MRPAWNPTSQSQQRYASEATDRTHRLGKRSPSAPSVLHNDGVSDAAASSSRSTVRYRGRGEYDRATIDPILDSIPVGTVAIADDAGPLALPLVVARVGDELITHASPASRLSRALKAGASACVTVWALDGIVAARSWFHHSMNYRAVVVQGNARIVTDRAEKLDLLRALTDHVMPGRSAETRPPTDKELAATAVFAFQLSEASAKVRTGPPIDDEADVEDWPVWAGVIPLTVSIGSPDADTPTRSAGVGLSPAVTSYLGHDIGASDAG